MEITKGRIPCAKKVVIYGPEGIGKSTFASQFPDPVFIDTEGSTNSMDVARLPKPTSWQMLLDEIQYVKSHPDVCKTLIIDTIDWAESMCIQSICDQHKKAGIEDFGYGNGYVYVKEEMGRFLNRLTEVIEAGINVVLMYCDCGREEMATVVLCAGTCDVCQSGTGQSELSASIQGCIHFHGNCP